MNVATRLNQEHHLGSMEVANKADVVAVRNNPLDDMSLMEDVGLVVKDGQIVKSLAM